MATKKKMLQAAAGNAGGAGLDVEEVFSTYLYEGLGARNNGIDLWNEGGMVWIKSRASANHAIFDTERGAREVLSSNTTAAQYNDTNTLTTFSSDGAGAPGFFVSSDALTGSSGVDYASWTFRKAPKFFDCVQYTGTGSAQTINHNLGSKPGFYVVKQTSGTGGSWYGYHAGLDSTYTNPSGIRLNSTSAAFQANSTLWNLTFPTSTGFTVGTSTGVNASGETYVAYLFAHNDGDGEFGPDGDADIIKCGSYTGNGSTTGPVIDLGFEPQWLLIKNSSASANWELVDSMRDFRSPKINVGLQALNPNLSNAEAEGRAYGATSTGFSIVDNHNDVNTSGSKYIYMAIRRGTKVPEDATEVFEPAITFDENNAPGFNSGFVTDMLWYRHPGNQYVSNDEMRVLSRLTQSKSLRTDSTAIETGNSTTFDFMDGASAPVNEDYKGWMWKRAPGYFDVVAYTGNGTADRQIPHNLSTQPELMIMKQRSGANPWNVFLGPLSSEGDVKIARLNSANASFNDPTSTYSRFFYNKLPTSSVFTIGDASQINFSGSTYIAYLFASLDGISKVGSYTGNGSSQTINCGFTSGARFILIKRTNSTGDWYVWDTGRGIVAGNDPHLSLNTTAAQVTTDDSVDPASSGFIVNQVSATNINVSSAEYIFYAIA